MITSALYLGIIVLWGFTWIAIKYSVQFAAPELGVVHRFIIASLILLMLNGFTHKPLKFKVSQHALMALVGSLICCFNFIFFYHAAQSLTSGLNAIVFSTSVIMIMLNNALFFKKRPTPLMLGGAVCGCLGLCAIFYPELKAFKMNPTGVKGLLLALGGSYCFSWGSMLSMRVSQQGIPLMSSTFYAMFYGAFFAFLFCLFKGISFHFELNTTYLLALGYLAIPGSVVGFLTYLSLVNRIGPEKAIYTTLFFPLVALTVSTFLESFQWLIEDVIGVIMILIGNMMVLYKPKLRVYSSNPKTSAA